MGQCLISTNGSGGIDPDELTATRSQVLAGYTAGVKGEDEPVSGTMPEKGAWTGSVGMNGSITIPEGHHSGTGKVAGPTITQRGAWTGSVGMNTQITIPEGYHNGSGKISGPTITLQNPDVPGASDRAYCTNISSWGGVMCLGVRNTRYLNGVNWIQADIPGLTAGNIRENVSIGNVKGTMKDYSYLAVNHIPFDGASFSGVLAEGAEICHTTPGNTIERLPLEMDQYGIKLWTSKSYQVYPTFCPKHSINFAPFRTVRVTACFSGNSRGAGYFKMEVWDVNTSRFEILTRYRSPLAYKAVDLPYSLAAKYTGDMDVSKVMGEGFLTISFTNNEGIAWSKYFINRIEFLT